VAPLRRARLEAYPNTYDRGRKGGRSSCWAALLLLGRSLALPILGQALGILGLLALPVRVGKGVLKPHSLMTSVSATMPLQAWQCSYGSAHRS